MENGKLKMENEITEVEKMYGKVGVKPHYDYTVLKEGYDGKITFTERAVLGKAQLFKNKKLRIIQVLPFYPDFTAEKQIALIKWLMKYDEIHGDYNDEYGFSTLNYSGKYKKDFEESLASVINNELWQDLTEQEKTEIRSILNVRNRKTL